MRFIALWSAANFVLSVGAIVRAVAAKRHRDAQVIAAAEEFGVGAAASPARVVEGGRGGGGGRRGMVGNPAAGGDDFRGHEGIDCRRREREQQQCPHYENGATEPE